MSALRSAGRGPSWESYVAERFDRLAGRFKAEVPDDDVRLRALVQALGPLDGLRVLDLGCGKGRFAVRLRAGGARVVGLDLSESMLAAAPPVDRVRGSARRLPFAAGVFDAVVAVEVLEHLDTVGPVLAEAARVLRPGGVLAVVDKNAGSWNAARPWLPNLVLKWVDQRRGRWMYPPGAPARERWFRPERLRRLMKRWFEHVDVRHLLTPSEARRALFRRVPRARLMTLWTARVPGGPS